MKKITTLFALLLFAVSQGAFAQETTTEAVIGNEEADISVLDNTVITALGIERNKKTLPYSLQEVWGNEMMKAGDANFMNALNGKVAGLEVKKTASGPGGSTRAILRGAKSFSEVSSPLYVIDGVPIVGSISGLNPNDIESISVLKGANAAVLYGSQGAHGVVLITTKKGREGVNVSISSSTVFEKALFIPEMQYKYGAIGGVIDSWSTTPHNNPNGYTEKDVENFFRRGNSFVNSVSISGGTNRITAYLSYANTASRGIIPENSYRKDNVTLNLSANFFNNKLTVGANVMYIDEMARNRPPNGYYLNPLTGLYWFPRNLNISDYRDGDAWRIWNDTRHLYQENWHVRSYHQSNPWWLINMQPRWDGGERLTAGANIGWNITKGLSFKVRGNNNNADIKNEQRYFAGSNDSFFSSYNGRWSYWKYKSEMRYFDGILMYNNNFGNISFDAFAGASHQEYRYGDGIRVDSGTHPLIQPNIFTFQNLPANVKIEATLSAAGIRKGLFANATIGFKEMIYLDLSSRNDNFIVLSSEGSQSNLSHSIGLSAIVSQMVSLPGFITFGKIRGSYAKVANEAPYDNIIPYNDRPNYIHTPGNPMPTSPLYDVKPEIFKSIELGADWRFFEGRLGVDYTWYQTTITDLFFNRPLQLGMGFVNLYLNDGKAINKGVELTVDSELVSTRVFSWKTAINYSHNKNKILVVDPERPNATIGLGNSEGYYSYIAAGGSFGDLYAYNFVYDEQGRIKLNAWNQPMRTQELEYIGSINPDFTLGWNNTFSYKRFSLDFLVNGVFCGKVMSMTEAMLDAYGVSKRTADARDNGNVVRVNGVSTNGNPVNEVIAYEWYAMSVGHRNGIFANYAYDRTNVRLTQFSFMYNIPVTKLPMKSASVGIIGQNLFFLYNKAPFDPELTMSAGRDSQGLDNFNVPSTRTFGFNIKVNF